VSGIVVVYGRSGGGVDQGTLDVMLDSISHRGPDGTNTWSVSSAAFGFQQLKSTPEAEYDRQPYEKDGIVLVADVRLDNRTELLSKLSTSREADKIPDSDILALSYQKWGEQCVDKLIGVFAFVIWDRNCDKIFCARDHSGIKPLYYTVSDEFFAVGSEKKALLSHPSIIGEIDEVKVGEYLINQYNSKDRSYFNSITRLPPAHALSITSDNINRRQYWELDPTRTITLESGTAYEKRFREILEKSVKCRLRGTGSIGTALSGGIDSSIITVISRDLLPDNETLHTFSNVYDRAPSSDEREYIQEVINEGVYDQHYIDDSGPGLLVDQDVIMHYFDQPIRNEMNFAMMKRLERAKKENVSIMLGGEQGDTTIGYGFELLSQLLWTGHLWKFYQEMQDLNEIFGLSYTNFFIYRFLPRIIPDPAVQTFRKIKNPCNPIESANPTISAEFVSRINLHSRYDNAQSGSILPQSARQRHHDSLVKPGLSESYSERDILSSAYNIEKRYPFTDKRLIEFCLAIPRTQQLRNGQPRSVARRAVNDLLPEKIRYRWDKTSGNSGFQKAFEQSLPQMNDIIDNCSRLSEFIDKGELELAIDRCSMGSYSPTDQSAIWRAVSLALWIEEFTTSN